MYIDLVCLYICVCLCKCGTACSRVCLPPCPCRALSSGQEVSKKGLRKHISPMCTWTQNGYGALISKEPSSSVVVGPKAGLARQARHLLWLRANAETRDRAGIFSLTLSQLSYRGHVNLRPRVANAH